MGSELLHEPEPRPHEVLAGPHERAQSHGRGRVGPERAQAMPVGAQDVGEDVGVGAVVLVAGAAVAGAQGLDPAAGDDDDRQARVEEGVHERAVGPLDGHAHDLPGGESPREPLQPGCGVLDLEALDGRAVLVDDADRVAPAGPVDARVRDGRMHPCLLAGASSLGAPLRDGTCPPVAH